MKNYTECKKFISKRWLKRYYKNKEKISNQRKINYEKNKYKLLKKQNDRHVHFKEIVLSYKELEKRLKAFEERADIKSA